MNKRSIKYKDTWAAPGSNLHAALEAGDQEQAAKIYRECEADARKLKSDNSRESVGKGTRWTDEQAALFFGLPGLKTPREAA